MVTPSLYVTRSGMSSQCSSVCNSHDRIELLDTGFDAIDSIEHSLKLVSRDLWCTCHYGLTVVDT